MQFELKIDGHPMASLDVDVAAVKAVLAHLAFVPATNSARSTPMTPAQVRELLSRVDPKSVAFLTALAKSSGELRWPQMQEIFEIDAWNDYSRRFGKGITRALRFVLGDDNAKLVWWDEADWPDDEEWSQSKVYVDGQALQSLQEVVASQER